MIVRDPIYWIFITGLFAASIFFTRETQIIRHKNAMARLRDTTIEDNTKVTILSAVDGDEILVKAEGKKQFVVRILGIKSFSSNRDDKDMPSFGKAAMKKLQMRAQTTANLRFSKFKVDSKKRVLAYVEQEGNDIGLGLVTLGLVMVYEEFSFERMKNYLSVEQDARKQKTGIWGHKRASEKALALKITWREANAHI